MTRKSQNRDDYQDVPGYISGMTRVFPQGELNPKHAHVRAQLIFAASGVMEISTSDRHWLIPPQLALWIPPLVEHEMRARTEVELRTLWVRVSDVAMPLPLVPTLVFVTPLLRELIIRAVDLPIESGLSGAAEHIVPLIFSELQFSRVGSFHIARVSDPRLARIEQHLREHPSDPRGVEDWAKLAGMSVSTFSRHLKTETGLSFVDWRLEIRLMEAMVRLVAGESITSIALSLGYENVGSFSRMFKRTMGASPSEIVRNQPSRRRGA